MNEKAMIYIVVFALMSVLSRLFNRWVFERILESANLKWEDVLNRRKELQGLDKQPRKMTSWILSVSPDRKETKKWFNIYNLINLPSIIFLSLSVMGLFTHLFDKILDIGFFIVLGIVMVSTVYGSISNFGRRRKP